MKKLVLVTLLSIFLIQLAKAQLKSDLGNYLTIKEKSSVAEQAPLSIRDFSYQSNADENEIKNLMQTQPGIAFLSSAILPGSAQAANGKWVRAGIYLATEAFSIVYYLNRTQTAKDQEQAYENFVHENWSVVSYAKWLVQYYETNGLSNNDLQQLKNQVNGAQADFSDTRNDWDKVDISLLQSIERKTPLVCGSCSNGNFSHVLPAYGSQQYYELVSKYYQFEAGWRDFNPQTINNYNFQYDTNGSFASPLFFLGAKKADEFNNNYRRAGNILSLLVVNHVVSAFDALFTIKLKNARLQGDADLMRADAFSLTVHF